MLSKRELYEAYYQGNSDEVIKKELIRYGNIVGDNSFKDSRGHWRDYIVMHSGMKWRLTMLNGFVYSLDWTY